MDDVRIQIVNYKTKAYLLRCFETVFEDLKNVDFKFSIAVLDNAPGDDLSDVPRKFPGQPIEIYQNEKNVGFGAGHNILAKHGGAVASEASEKYLLLLNPDVEIIEPHTIERLLRRIKESKAAIVGPRLVTTEKHTTQRWDHGELSGFRAWVAQSTGHSFWKERKSVARVAWIYGAVFLIEKSWFDRLGGFDEKFFLYGEELELCFRLRALGGGIIYDSTITVFHHAGVVAKKSDYLRASNDYFLKKHFRQRWDYRALRLINKILN